MPGKSLLEGKKGLVVGIANDNSIAYGCARTFREHGAEIAVTYLNEKAKKFVEPLAQQLDAPIFMPLDVTIEEQSDRLFAAIEETWGKLDFVLHSIAYCPAEDLHGRVVDSSGAGFSKAMDISCHSFLRLAKRAEPLMKDGGSLLTVSYYGAEKVVDHYNIMGPVKAALEACVQYSAVELGRKNIRVHAISPGPIPTRAASGISGFDDMLDNTRRRTPSGLLPNIEDVGETASFLISDKSKALTGSTIYIDHGYNLLG